MIYSTVHLALAENTTKYLESLTGVCVPFMSCLLHGPQSPSRKTTRHDWTLC